MASGNAIPPTKNRGARGKKAANEGDSSTPKKRGRKPKNAERAAVPRPQGDDDDDEEESPTKEDSPTMEESPTKKVKIENGDDHKEKLGADEKVTSEGAEAGVEVV